MKKLLDFCNGVLASFRLSRNMNRLMVFKSMMEGQTDITSVSYVRVVDWLRDSHPLWGIDILPLAEARLGLRKTGMLIELGEELLYGDGREVKDGLCNMQ